MLERSECFNTDASYLRRNDQIVLLPPVLLDRLPQDDFRLAARVYLRGIEEVDSCVVRRFHALKGGFCMQ